MFSTQAALSSVSSTDLLIDSDQPTESIAQFKGISSMQDVQIFAKKPGGTRAGFVGFHEDNCYMVKIEKLGYCFGHAGRVYETAAMESFTAQFIRKIWGNDFATDIRVAKFSPTSVETFNPDISYEAKRDIINQSAMTSLTLSVYEGEDKLEKCQNLKVTPINDKYFTAESYELYAVVVPFERNAMSFDRWNNGMKWFSTQREVASKINDRYCDLLLISKILNIADVKDENMILVNGSHLKIIDCSAQFLMRQEDVADIMADPAAPKILQAYLNFGKKELDEMLRQYKGILCSETMSQIESRIQRTRALLENGVKYSLEG